MQVAAVTEVSRTPEPMTMSVKKTKASDGTTTLSIAGRFNFTCYAQFNEALQGPPATQYVVDLSLVDYMDSSALGMLLLLRDKVGQDAKRVLIRTGTGQPSNVLKMANFSQLFSMA